MDDKIRLALEILGTDGVKGLQAALSGLNDESGQVAAAFGRGELSAEQYDAEMARVGASAKNLEAVLRGLNAEMARQAGETGHHADAAEARELAEAEEMLAAALRHEEEMARSAAEETAKLAEAERDGVAQVAAWERQQREAADAAKKLEAANRDLNRALRDDAVAEARGKLAALEADAGDVANAFARGDISARVFARDMDTLGDESAQLRARLAGLEQEARSEAAATDRATAATDRATAAKGKLETAAKKASGGVSGMGQSFLQTGRIVQDFAQGGFGGVINNIEGFTQAVGLGTGMAGALTVLGTTLFVLKPQIADFFASLSDRRLPDLGQSIATFKERLEELTGRPHKLDLDYSRIDEARKILDAMEKKLAAFKAIGDQTPVQEKVGKAVNEVIREDAGGTDEQSGKENLEKLLTAAGGLELQDEAIRTSKTEKGKQIREAEARLEDLQQRKPEDLAEAAAIGEQIRSTEESIAALKHDMAEIVKEKVDEIIGGAARGIEADRARIAALFDKNEKLFTQGDKARGIAPVAPLFRFDLEQARGANIEQKDRDERRAGDQQRLNRLDKDLAKKAADDLKGAQQQQVDDLSRSEALAPDAQGFARAANADGAAAEDAFEAVRKQVTATILARLRARGLGADGIDKVADEAAGKVANAAAEGIARKAFDAVGQNETRAQKAAARDDRKQDAGARKQAQEQRQKADKESARTFDASVENSGAADMAGSMLAEIQAAGGVKDQRTGKLHRLTPEQQFEYVRKQVEKWLHRQTGFDQFGRPQFANRGMGAEETGLTATAIAQRGQQEVTHRLAGMAGQQGSNTGKLIGIASSLNAEVMRLRQQTQHQAQQIDDLGRQVRATRQSNQKKMR